MVCRQGVRGRACPPWFARGRVGARDLPGPVSGQRQRPSRHYRRQVMPTRALHRSFGRRSSSAQILDTAWRGSIERANLRTQNRARIAIYAATLVRSRVTLLGVVLAADACRRNSAAHVSSARRFSARFRSETLLRGERPALSVWGTTDADTPTARHQGHDGRAWRLIRRGGSVLPCPAAITDYHQQSPPVLRCHAKCLLSQASRKASRD